MAAGRQTPRQKRRALVCSTLPFVCRSVALLSTSRRCFLLAAGKKEDRIAAVAAAVADEENQGRIIAYRSGEVESTNELRESERATLKEQDRSRSTINQDEHDSDQHLWPLLRRLRTRLDHRAELLLTFVSSIASGWNNDNNNAVHLEDPPVTRSATSSRQHACPI